MSDAMRTWPGLSDGAVVRAGSDGCGASARTGKCAGTQWEGLARFVGREGRLAEDSARPERWEERCGGGPARRGGHAGRWDGHLVCSRGRGDGPARIAGRRGGGWVLCGNRAEGGVGLCAMGGCGVRGGDRRRGRGEGLMERGRIVPIAGAAPRDHAELPGIVAFSAPETIRIP